MKMYYFIVWFLVLSSCHKPTVDEIAQNRVKEHLDSEFKGQNKYKSILFGRLDSAFTTVKGIPEYKRNDACAKLCELLVHTSEDTNQANLYADSAKYYKAKCDTIESMFVPEFKGWKIQSIYQTWNENDELLVNKFVFYLDKNLQSIIDREQIYKNLPRKTFDLDTEFYGIK